jgi:flagellar assembly factor FliW
MKIHTDRFGPVDVDDSQVAYFDEGLVGFPGARRFYIIRQDPGVPFMWLQDGQDPSLTFVVIEPRHFRLDYSPRLPRDDEEALGLKGFKDAEVYALVVIPSDPGQMTANLKAPIIINRHTRRARQVILDDDEYGIRHKIIEEFLHAAEQGLKTRKGSGR